MNNRTFKRSQKTGKSKVFMKTRLIAAAAILSMTGSAWAQGRELVTALSRDVIGVGESVPLIYRFVNTPDPVNMPQAIAVEGGGAEITLMGAQRQRNMNFSFGPGGLQDQSESAIEYTYIVRAVRPGNFTIRSFKVEVGGRQMKTEAVKFRVVGGGAPVPRAAPARPNAPPGVPGALDPFDLLNQMLQGGSVQIPVPVPGGPGFPFPMPQPGGPPPTSGRDGEDFFAEMNVGAKTAFVGQAVPVDLRFYFPAGMVRDGWQPPEPQFSGDGFSVAPLSSPKQTVGEKNGGEYRIVTFRTAIIPAKTGDLEIPPATVGIQLVGGGMFGRAEEIKVTSNAAKLRVEPLPEEGRPLSFSGAIGQDLKLSSSVSPKSAEPGEPLEYTLTISGRGNFDAMVAPELSETSGWRTYQPKETFQADDATGFGGSKSFEYKIVARRDQTATPGAEFSYFDLAEKKYVTRVAAPIAVDAKGRESSAAEPAADGGSTPAEDGAPQAETTAGGIGEAAKDLASRGQTGFAPLLSSPSFWWINVSIAAALLIALPLVLWMRRRAARNAFAHELQWALKQAQSALAKASDRAEFYNAATHLVQARLAVGEGKKARFIDTGAALRRQVGDPVMRREIESVLGRRDELKYGGNTAGSLDPAEKNRVVAVLEKFSANHD